MANYILLKIRKIRLEGDQAIGLLHQDSLKRLEAQPGDIIYANDKHWWYGGLRSVHVRAGKPLTEEKDKDVIGLTEKKIKAGNLKEGQEVKVEKIM